MRLIDANSLIDRMVILCDEYGIDDCTFDNICCEIEQAPTVDAAPVVHGRWVLIEEGQNTSVYQCSKCKRMVNVVCDKNLREQQLAKNYPYCNCGAKMDRKDDK